MLPPLLPAPGPGEAPSAGQWSYRCATGSLQSCSVTTLVLIWYLSPGKDPTENHKALEEFKKFTEGKGFLQENIIVPKQRGEWVTLEITS